MKKLLFIPLFFIFLTAAAGAELLNPLDFKGTKEEKEKIISFIRENVRKTCTNLGMGNASTLRMMEKEELKKFKLLTKVKNYLLLAQIIKRYCDIGMCSYSTIYMMYNHELRASQKSLAW